jgi:hypothetical protein
VTLFITLGVMIPAVAIVSGPVMRCHLYPAQTIAGRTCICLDGFQGPCRRNFRHFIVAGLFSLLVTIVFVFNLAFYSQSAFVGNLSRYGRTIVSVMLICYLWTIMRCTCIR